MVMVCNVVWLLLSAAKSLVRVGFERYAWWGLRCSCWSWLLCFGSQEERERAADSEWMWVVRVV